MTGPEKILVMGIDLGQKREPTAICVAEIKSREIEDSRRRKHGETEFHFVVRFLKRLPLETPYPEVARRVGEVCEGIAEQSGCRPRIFVDATGMGAPVVDLLEEETSSLLWSVYFTHGDRRTEEPGERRVTLGKGFLVSRLQALLQRKRVHFPRNAEAGVLVDELLNYEIRADERANDLYGAFRVGTHDDLVTALGLAVQTEPRLSVSCYPGVVLQSWSW